jgi:serine/threonine protein kinase/tetratricopeptide (TPR) repeat protein
MSAEQSLDEFASGDEVMAQLVEEVTDKLQQGEPIDLADYERRYPFQTERLRKVLPALAELARAGSSPAAAELSFPPVMSAGDSQLGTLGDFRLLREVGRGGMGVVYEAEQLSLGRRVALKVLPFAATMDGRYLQRFRNEARAAAGLEHPHIVPVYGVGCERGVHYYAMKFIDGRSLADLVAHQREGTTQTAENSPAAETLPIAGQVTERTPRDKGYYRRVAEWGVQAAEALDHAHGAGVVHRDIKPANLLLDGHGQLWVADFGLARVGQDGGLTATGDVVGTLRYMSPEQALGQRGIVDHRADVYSLGATLYELLTLQPAFAGGDRQELLRQIADEEPRPLRRVNRSVPAELETIVAKAMEKSPADRYGTAQELADDLRRFLEDQPIRARRPTLGERVRRWSRRHQALVRAVAVAVLLALVGLAASTAWAFHMYTQTEEARANEETERIKADDAAREERKAKFLAEERRQQAEAIADLLRSVFRNLDPRAGPSDALAIKQQLIAQLDTAAAKLEPLAADPLTRARLQCDLGRAFRGLGAANKAELQLKAARAILQAQLGLDNRETLDCMYSLARSYADADQRRLALPLFKQVLDRRMARFGPDDPETVGTMDSLGHAYHLDGQFQMALPLIKQALEKRRQWLGDDHPETLSSKNNLGMAYLDAGDARAALPLLKEVLKVRQATPPADHPDTLNSMNNLALAYLADKNVRAAVPLFEEALEKRRKRLPPDHADTLQSIHNLAIAYRAAGGVKKPLALSLSLEAFTKRKSILGPKHRDTLLSMNSLAVAYQDAGQLDKALDLYEQALTTARAIYKDVHPIMLTILHNRASLYQAAGKLDRALEGFEEALANRKNVLGPTHPETLATRDSLTVAYREFSQRKLQPAEQEQLMQRMAASLGPEDGDTLLVTMRLAESHRAAGNPLRVLQLYEQLVKNMERTFGRDHHITLHAMNNWASANAALRRVDKVIAILKEALDRQRKAPKFNAFVAAKLRNNLIDVYTEQGQLHEAEPLLREALALQIKANGVQNSDTVLAQLALAMNLLQQHRYAAAEKILRPCLQTRERFERNNWKLFNAKVQLGRCLWGQKKYAEAEPLLLQGYEGMKAAEPGLPPNGQKWLIEATRCLVELYDAWGKPEQARTWRQRLNEVSPGHTTMPKN